MTVPKVAIGLQKRVSFGSSFPDSIITLTFAHTDQDPEAVTSWVTQRSVGRSEDSRLSVQHRQSADAAIEQLIHAKFLQSLPVVPQLDGIDDEYDDVGV